MNKSVTFRRIALAASLSVATGGAMASDHCTSVFTSLQSTLAGSGLSAYLLALASYQDSYPGCFASATPGTTYQEIVATSFNQMGLISQNLGSRLLGGGPTQVASAGGSGLAAGGKAGAWNAWASYSSDESNYRVKKTVAGAVGSPFDINNDSSVNNLVFGGDYRLSPALVVGASLALDEGKGVLRPTTLGRTNTSARGQSVAAYLGWQMDKNWALDATVGYGIGSSNPGVGTTADSTRRFAGVNATYANWIGNWQLSGKAGYQFAAEEFENARRGLTLPNTYYTARLGQVKAGGEVGYFMADGIMPYVGVAYVSDVSRNRVRVSQLWDDDALILSAGVNFFSLKNNLTGGIAYTDELSRTFIKHSNWMANINYRF